MTAYWGEITDRELLEARLSELFDIPEEKIDKLLNFLDNYIDERIDRKIASYNYDRS